MENSKQPAYPIDTQGHPIHPNEFIGLTKREYFAAMAMQAITTGIFSSQNSYGSFSESAKQNDKTVVTHVISLSLSTADELLKQLENGK